MIYQAKKGENLLQVIAKKDSSLDASCAGRGICGKCKIQLVSGNLPFTETEKKRLSKEELDSGIRLACVHMECEQDCTFTLGKDQSGFVISGNSINKYEHRDEDGYAIAVDLGTTTVVMDLIHLKTGTVEKEITFVNPQKIYGADVITRVDYSMKNGVKVLQSVLLAKMEEAILSFECSQICRMCVCGNAVMTHIFMGEDPTSIAQAPYVCKVKEYVEIESTQFFNTPYLFTVQVLPPMSAYVGSDIVMDVYESQMMKKEKVMLIDLGTNGEIVLVKDDCLYASSAACGPAFESGNMECGSGAVAGAVNKVYYEDGWKYTTIQGQTPHGVCGSGYMSWISSALKQGLIEENGWMEEDIWLDDSIVLSQKDVREFQLAKSAIASACEVLCMKAGIDYSSVDSLLIAGGFGNYVDKNDLAVLGIIPEQLLSKVTIIGNSAIRGCCRYAIMQDLDHLKTMISKSKVIGLASEIEFTERFMMNIMFMK